VQAHTLGEVGNLGTVSLRVCSGTILPIFIEICSYLTEKEQKISWHSFFETPCRYDNCKINHDMQYQKWRTYDRLTIDLMTNLKIGLFCKSDPGVCIVQLWTLQ